MFSVVTAAHRRLFVSCARAVRPQTSSWHRPVIGAAIVSGGKGQPVRSVRTRTYGNAVSTDRQQPPCIPDHWAPKRPRQTHTRPVCMAHKCTNLVRLPPLFCSSTTASEDHFLPSFLPYYASPLISGGIKRYFCLTSDVCLSRTSGLSQEQRGLGRLKLAQG